MAAKDSKIVTLDDDATDDVTTGPVPKDSAPEVVVKGSNHDDQLCGDKVRIEIHEGSDDAGKEDAFVQINGYAYSIQRGVEVVVPVEVLHVLENATMTQYTAAQGGGHKERNVKRFAYSVLGKIPAEKK